MQIPGKGDTGPLRSRRGHAGWQGVILSNDDVLLLLLVVIAAVTLRDVVVGVVVSLTAGRAKSEYKSLHRPLCVADHSGDRVFIVFVIQECP